MTFLSTIKKLAVYIYLCNYRDVFAASAGSSTGSCSISINPNDSTQSPTTVSKVTDGISQVTKIALSTISIPSDGTYIFGIQVNDMGDYVGSSTSCVTTNSSTLDFGAANPNPLILTSSQRVTKIQAKYTSQTGS